MLKSELIVALKAKEKEIENMWDVSLKLKSALEELRRTSLKCKKYESECYHYKEMYTATQKEIELLTRQIEVYKTALNVIEVVARKGV